MCTLKAQKIKFDPLRTFAKLSKGLGFYPKSPVYEVFPSDRGVQFSPYFRR